MSDQGRAGEVRPENPLGLILDLVSGHVVVNTGRTLSGVAADPESSTSGPETT